MNRASLERKIEEILGPDLVHLEHNMIVREGRGYRVFGRYTILDNHIYKHTTDIGKFSSPRIALSWCIADKYQQHRLAQDIEYLDRSISYMATDVETRTHLAKKIRDPQHKSNVNLKINRKIEQLKQTQERLDKCVNLAKYYQIRGFNNETARTGRPTSYRTSR